MRLIRRAFALAVSLAVVPVLHAETAMLRDGRSIEVTGYRMSADRIVLKTTTGVEVSLAAADVLEIRRQPREVPPVPTAPATAAQAPEPAPTAPGAPPAASGAPAAIAAGAEGPGEQLLPVGGVFD